MISHDQSVSLAVCLSVCLSVFMFSLFFLNILSETGSERNVVRINDRHNFKTILLRRSNCMNCYCLLIATCVSTCVMPIAFVPNNFSGGGNVTLLPFIVAGLSLIALGSCLSNLIDIALVSTSRGSSPTSCVDNMLSPTLLIRVQAFRARTFVCRIKKQGRIKSAYEPSGPSGRSLSRFL